ncbi:MAG TPA: M1 family metallopeptidase [Longimicrobiaceae bacterium]|nr:M1 family metallopeptidase [Longimicrobiaceae bacterium]
MPKPGVPAVLFLALLAGACAGSGGPAAGPTPSDTATRHLLRPVPVPAAFRAAIERGTRTTTGAPGPRYWQQEVSYRIEAELDPATALLRGREWIVYRNRSPHPIRSVVLNLYQNIYSEGVPRNRFAPVTGGVQLERVAAQGEALRLLGAAELQEVRDEPPAGAPAGYAVRGTLARIVLPRPIAPGDSAVLEADWRHTVPPAPSFRTAYAEGRRGRGFLVAQWYPQVAVFDDVAGWDATPYLGDGEFYLEYGDFDVALTLPAGWVAGATGVLLNPGEVLAPGARRRLDAAARSDTVVRVITEADLDAGRATLSPPGGKLTWRFRGEDVRDFAFAASNRYRWDVLPAPVAGGGGEAGSVLVHALYRAGTPAWDEGARFGRHAVEFFSRTLAPYPYPQVTVAEGPMAGGMEYPQIVFIGGYSDPKDLHSGIVHEVGHQWFPMLVGSDEAANAWMDEGVVTYYEMLGRNDLFPEDDLLAPDRAGYLSVAGGPSEVPLMRHTDLVSPYGARYIAAYSKPALLLRSLRAVVGEEPFRRAMDAYLAEWRFRHPTPWDFFNTFERVSGRDLGWFFYPWWWETGTSDLAVERVEVARPGTVRVTVRDVGEVPVPAVVVVTTASGATARAEIPVAAWLAAGSRTATVDVAVSGAPVRVEVDPEKLFPDVSRGNNTWSRAQGGVPTP